MTERLSYPVKAVMGDYARAAIGIIFTGVPALSLGQWTFAHWLLVPLCLLFLVFAWRTRVRQRTAIVWDDTGLSLSGSAQASVRWNQVRSLKLAFYATGRDRTGGWMQLTLKSDAAKISADSAADNFPAFAARAALAAQALDLPIDDATRANFNAIGIPFAPSVRETAAIDEANA
ncbi:MAG: hypothetical protein ING44_01940 [Telmatospirillum sp.]|nr:hypothetical protein [Telmatospirillum sp.]